jgi:hypothetical protein
VSTSASAVKKSSNLREQTKKERHGTYSIERQFIFDVLIEMICHEHNKFLTHYNLRRMQP